VEAIRASPEFLPELSLVATSAGKCRHVMISHATIRDGEESHRVAMLSPWAVAPQFQRRGVGSHSYGR